MDRFIQLHLLTAYPPANLNRDDLHRPKTAMMGGAERLRISSQSLKRNWRTSQTFQEALEGHIGSRTRLLGRKVYTAMRDGGVDHKKALAWAKEIAGVFGALKKLSKEEIKKIEAAQGAEKEVLESKGVEIEQLAHISPEEDKKVMALAERLTEEKRAPEKEELNALRSTNPDAVDVALFGRMMAAAPDCNVEAACQVAHAITVHPVTIEDDYFTAVDDLNSGNEDLGAGHIGELGFGAGLFYVYICINTTLLQENLKGDTALAERAVGAVCETAMRVAPKAKQNAFGSRAYASYVLAETGDAQPRSLSVAFLHPVGERPGVDFAKEGVDALRKQVTAFDAAYGPCAKARMEICAIPDMAQADGWASGNLETLLGFLTQ